MGMTWISRFADGNGNMKEILGGKGANLADMTALGLPVPPGFTITTGACRAFFHAGTVFPDGMIAELQKALSDLEEQTGKRFGDPYNPLLVSVRSGAVTSMPGMMDTILNLGLNDSTVSGLAAMTSDTRFAYDCYRRLVQMFGNVVFGIPAFYFEDILRRAKLDHGFQTDQDITGDVWMKIIEDYKQVIRRHVGKDFPQDVRDQLHLAVEAVFRSWHNDRAVVYRKVHRISEQLGTAVNIQAMVFGNMGEDSGTGVVFTRNPSTGESVLFGEFLTNAQGEDVVAGIRTPQPIDQLAHLMPEVFAQLQRLTQQLERHHRDLQDIEFTVEHGHLYLLQTRNGKRTAQAAVKIAVHLADEGLITVAEALQRISASHLNQLLHRTIDEGQHHDVIAKGLPASPGAASGQVVFDADTAQRCAKTGQRVILVRTETTPEDIHGVLAAEAVLTSHGGMTSHAAVIARGMGKTCVCGCESIRINESERLFTVGDTVINEGDWISIDGFRGEVILGVAALQEPQLSAELFRLMGWADELRDLRILANADTLEDAAKAREYGAQGIGLCRTEHMFMSADRLPIVQAMILAENEADRRDYLDKLLPMQQADFVGIFRAMTGLPVTIRLLDPPLHEFLPNLEDLLQQQWKLHDAGAAAGQELRKVDLLLRRVRALREVNPMLGLRGCRLGIVYPEIYEMQVESILRAAILCHSEGLDVKPNIMVPLVGHANELRLIRDRIDQVAARVFAQSQIRVPYQIGTMIEVPRAALTANQIASSADFFSFGTNDLTQMTFGFSRDDAEGKFLSFYEENDILPVNPFVELDEDGVGELIRWASRMGKQTNPELELGICGEHGGNPESIVFCHNEGLDYVSCSPYRVPLARIAAAQAAVRTPRCADGPTDTHGGGESHRIVIPTVGDCAVGEIPRTGHRRANS